MPSPAVHRAMLAAVAHHQAGRLEQAAQIYQNVLQHEPQNPDALHLMALVHYQTGRVSEAIPLFKRALAIKPHQVEFHVNAAAAFRAVGQLDAARVDLDAAVRLQPTLPEAHNNLGGVCKDLGLIDEAIAAYRRAVALNPRYVAAHSNLLLALNYSGDQPPEQIYAEHARFGQVHSAGLSATAPHANSREAGRVIRVGYVSPDFKEHAVSRFFEPILAHHDRGQFHVTCYFTAGGADLTTARLRGQADQWREVAQMSDDQLAGQIRGDGIDVLVDLAGHTGESRPLLFARKPAPVQITYLGYPNTTGLKAMDYRMTDELADPPGRADALHTEKLLRLPGCFLCFRPPEVDLPPRPPRGQHPFTFVSFNNFAKVTQDVLGLWMRLLLRFPGSRLVLKSKGLQEASVRTRLASLATGHGIDPARLVLHPGHERYRDHLAAYHEADLALDTFPYNGTTTTCEAMFMGVPVVTRVGVSHVSRVGLSLLNAAGMGELVASDEAAYLDLAAGLAADVERIGSLGGSLRERLLASPLTDGRAFTRHFENALRTAWVGWCESAG